MARITKYYSDVAAFNNEAKTEQSRAAKQTSSPTKAAAQANAAKKSGSQAKEANVPRNLAPDPVAARLSKARLDQVEGRMARLQKAIDILSYATNPEWEREFNDLAADIRKNADEQFRVGLDGLTAGMSQAANLASARNVKLAKEAVDLPVWKNLADERGQLEHLVSSSVLLKGPAGDGLRKTVAAMKRLESARNLQGTSDALSNVRDALSAAMEIRGQAKDIKDPATATALYRGSAMIGLTASLFTSAAIKEVTLPAELVFKVGEASFLVKGGHEQDEQMERLSQGSYDRHQKQLELEKTMGELQEERSRLKWAIQRAQ